MTKPSEHDAFESLERAIKASREANGMNEPDDLVSARPNVWLVFAWLAVCAAMAMLLTACGGGIDTADEFMGPPAPITDVKPCPVNPAACHPEPSRG